MFPSILKPYKFSLIDYLHDLATDFIGLFYVPYVYYLLATIKGADTPLKMKRPEYVGNAKVQISKLYNLHDYDDLRKNKLKISFNDFIVSVISKALNRVCKDKGYTDIKNFTTGVPVGISYLPTDSSYADLTNKVTGLITSVPAVNDIKSDSIAVSDVLRKQLHNKALVKGLHLFENVALEFVPINQVVDLHESFGERVDFICSNLPGPCQPIYYDGCKVTDVVGIVYPGWAGIFIPVVSYNNHFRITVSAFEYLNFNEMEFFEYVDRELTELRGYSD
jgi:hypothetical protein